MVAVLDKDTQGNLIRKAGVMGVVLAVRCSRAIAFVWSCRQNRIECLIESKIPYHPYPQYASVSDRLVKPNSIFVLSTIKFPHCW